MKYVAALNFRGLADAPRAACQPRLDHNRDLVRCLVSRRWQPREGGGPDGQKRWHDDQTNGYIADTFQKWGRHLRRLAFPQDSRRESVPRVPLARGLDRGAHPHTVCGTRGDKSPEGLRSLRSGLIGGQ